MNPVQYIILNKSLGMSTGKAAAQAAHASQMGLLTHVDGDTRESPYNKSIVNLWMRGGHYAKVVLETTDDLGVVAEYLAARGFYTYTVIDEGRTELPGLTRTAIGTGVVDKDSPHTRDVFGEFKLYTDSVPSDAEILAQARKIQDERTKANIARYMDTGLLGEEAWVDPELDVAGPNGEFLDLGPVTFHLKPKGPQ